MKKTIIASSMDPITYGHYNVIQRALYVFDKIIVGIGINPDKKYTFSLEKREFLTRNVLTRYGMDPYLDIHKYHQFQSEILNYDVR